jgi:hypothetical protein
MFYLCSGNIGLWRTKSENQFQDFNVYEMKYAILIAPHNFDGKRSRYML